MMTKKYMTHVNIWDQAVKQSKKRLLVKCANSGRLTKRNLICVSILVVCIFATETYYAFRGDGLSRLERKTLSAGFSGSSCSRRSLRRFLSLKLCSNSSYNSKHDFDMQLILMNVNIIISLK